MDMPQSLTIRDWFAGTASEDEVNRIERNMSIDAKSALIGVPYPSTPSREAPSNAIIYAQIDQAMFTAAVFAAIRFILADALMSAREKI